MWILQPEVEGKHCFHIAGVGHGDLKRGKFEVPFIDRDAAHGFWGWRSEPLMRMNFQHGEEREVFCVRGSLDVWGGLLANLARAHLLVGDASGASGFKIVESKG